MTMSIDQAASEYIKKIHYFGRKIQSATQALSNVRNMISYANWIKRRYGLTDQQMRQITMLPQFFGMHDRLNFGAYVPECYKKLCYIDQRTESMLEEIFTITTESDQEQEPDLSLDGEFRSRNETLTLGSLTGSQYRDYPGAWARMKRRLIDQKRRREVGRVRDPTPNSDNGHIALQQFPVIEQKTWTGPAPRRPRAASSTVGAKTTGKFFSRASSGVALLGSSKRGSVNNNHSPRLASNKRNEIDRELISPAIIEIGGDLIDL